MSHPHEHSHSDPHEHEHADGHAREHAREHAHADGHAHEHPHEHEWHDERLHHEDFVLDIGGDVGALMLITDARYAEREIEVSPVGDDTRRTHTAIHERQVNGETRYVGVYPALTQGEYRVWADEPGLPERVEIRGGEVAILDWTTTTPAPLLPNAAPGSDEEAR